jgi:aspartate ammonia-lyase
METGNWEHGTMRIEKDFIGTVELPEDVLYGIHSMRAKKNFPYSDKFHQEWYCALGVCKLAVFEVYQKFVSAVLKKYPNTKLPIELFSEQIIGALKNAAKEISEGKHFGQFIVPATQGGAGTSINMNINEILANAALISVGRNPGDYAYIDPIAHANVFQSTNDIVPTSLKVAILRLLPQLEEKINTLRKGIELLEQEHRNTLRIAYTQMQEAVPSSYGRLLSTYNDALSRDWWRVSKCFERIKVVNLGGTAIGTGITVPRFYLMEVVGKLQELTKLPVTRGENLQDATANLDSFVEIHATMKAHAVNLEKMVNDIRLLASDLIGRKEVSIPKVQVGSSIMPAKVNPVIPEYVIGIAHKIYSNDMLITGLCAQGCLDLNAYLPIIGHALLESLKLLISANQSIEMNLISGLSIDQGISSEKLFNSPAVTTALIPFIGYNNCTTLANLMKIKNISIFEANKEVQLISEEKLKDILSPANLLKAGFAIDDLLV